MKYDYDYDIRETFDANFGEDAFFHLCNNIDDREILRLAIEFLKGAADRLDSDLDNKEIYYEYRSIVDIIIRLQYIEKNYV